MLKRSARGRMVYQVVNDPNMMVILDVRGAESAKWSNNHRAGLK